MSSESDTSGDEGDFSENEKPLAGATEYTSVRIYTEQDMFPTKIDPLCEIPDWPLATYWPVFLGGFRVESWIESTWSVQISNYFACRGLLTRMMVFPRSRDDIFEKYQQNVLMLDALVYFTSKEDAKRAVATCHHQFYYGYRLNVLPGRFPLYYDPVRTIRFHKVGVDRVVERIVLRSLSKFGDIDFLARYPRDDVVVEFASVEDMLCALRNQKRLRPQEVTGPTQKQRFVEQDVIRDIQDAMRQNYGFMTMQPEMEILVQLFTGQQPNVNTLWNTQRPLKTRFSEKRKYFKKRRLNGSKYSKHRWEAQNVIETNKILQKHGLPPISGQNISGRMPKMTKGQKRQYRANKAKETQNWKRKFKNIKKMKTEPDADVSDARYYDSAFDNVKIKIEPGSSQDPGYGNSALAFVDRTPSTFKIKSEPGSSGYQMNNDTSEMMTYDNEWPSTSSGRGKKRNRKRKRNPYDRNPPNETDHHQQPPVVDRGKLVWRNPNMVCNHCGKPGHFRENCFHLRR